MARAHVLLVFGGDSSEHAVSCLTAAGVLAATDRDRFEVTCVGIAPGGRWVLVDEATVLAYAVGPDGALPQVTPEHPDAVLLRTPAGLEVARRDADGLAAPVAVDVAFALLHGPFGEDGTVQGLFEMMGVRYVGAGVLASAVCQDKIAMKQLLLAHGLEVGPFVGFDDRRWREERDAVLRQVDELAYPLFVKPNRGGSSIGITRVTGPEQLVAAVEHAREHDPVVIVEQGLLDVREVECAVLGGRAGGTPRASLPGEVIVHGEDKFYDFETKYLPGQGVTLAAPADLSPELVERVQEVAREAFSALGVEGLARVDTFVLPSGEVVVNELNTMPGFTTTSMYPILWGISGLDYTSLVTELLDLALARPVGLR